MTPNRKLLVDQKVEVRSTEDGFLGSWHTGTVIRCKHLVRVVRYDHLFVDEQMTKNLTQHVKVSPVVDGVGNAEIAVSDNYRGRIRPSLPHCALNRWSIHYGQCVDYHYADAWWEGVVTDHEDGCERRRIFFPDMGDEMEARVDMLRLSKDWDEVTEEWKPRGNWLFLELIEEVEQDWPLPVSVKQIWYEVRLKNGFEKLGEWTSCGRLVWRELVMGVLFDNFMITVRQLFVELNSSWDSEELGQPILEFSEPALDVVLKTEGFFRSCCAVVPYEAKTDLKSREKVPELIDQAQISTVLSDELAVSVSDFALPVLSQNPDEGSVIGSNAYNDFPDMISKLPDVESIISTQTTRLKWKPAVPEIITGAEFHPKDMDKCSAIFRAGKRPPSTVTMNAKKHILHCGWKIYHAVDKRMIRLRYFSPNGESFDSLRQVCLNFQHVCHELEPGSPMLMSPNIDRNGPVCSSEVIHSPPPPGKSRASGKLSKLCTPSPADVIEPEYCPEAVREYYLLGEKNKNFFRNFNSETKSRAVKARKHLSAIGWSFYYHQKGDKREIRYISPSGVKCLSLLSACKWCVQTNALDLSPTIGKMGNVNIIREFDDHLSINNSHHRLVNNKPLNLPNVSFDISRSKGLVPSVGKTRISRNKRKQDKSHSIESSPLRKRRRKSHGSMKLRRRRDADSSTPVRRSSKRARDIIASSSQQTPRTVLSWLIDNNVVLPRAKVYYRGSNHGPELAEGRIVREGIKCSCCGEIFGLCKFEAHADAGSINHRPSANIFLEDGRSLLDCQLQLKKHKIKRESCEIKGRRYNKKNDYICSICHYGGELVLCDQCPSSFHTRCLGLKEVPEGDWFCPSCCCQICRQSRFDEKNGRVIDSSVLICGQCEHRYHAECVRNKGIINRNAEGNWFCGDTCEQIFSGLRKILGKPLRIETENLTWTLVKYMKSKSHDLDASDEECLVEYYSKLNVALSVMHECFEPVTEPGSRRDLVEDVIFSRWSELNRLNFQGFYTVLLEKNDEQISVATVRIYGKRVAEVPLVATRFQYRRLGMCRILMDELEKKLIELGVERLVLPAAPSVLNAWTTSFGFSVMNESERLNFLDHTFLDFQGTVFCQKALTSKTSLVAASLFTGTQATSCDHVNENVSIELDGNRTASEDFQGEVVEETDIVKQGPTSIATFVEKENGNCSAQLATVVDHSTLPNCIPFQTKILLGVTDNKQDENRNEDGFICYKRRKFSAC